MNLNTLLLSFCGLATLLASGMSAVNPKLISSDFSKWERVPVKKFGFTVDAPKDRRFSRVSNDIYEIKTGHGLYDFGLHPIRIGPGIEDRHVIEAYFIHMTADQYRVIVEKQGYSDFGTISASTLHIFHKEPKEYQVDDFGKPAVVFRKDYRGSTGQVVAIIIVRYDYVYAESLRESDRAPIQRILNSVKFIK